MAATCPIPHVADALSPYIKPRTEVTAIRQNLHSYLERHLQLEDNQALSSTNISDPPLTGTLQEPPNAFSGVRRAYWRALRAHQAARARYENLKADLLQFSEVDSAPNTGKGADLLPLVRLREKRRKLQVLDRGFSGIEDGTIGAGVDDLVLERVGEAPVPPSAQRTFGGNGTSGKAAAEERVLELKKAVLSAQRVVESQQHDVATTNGAGGHGEVYALQQARNELIGWIEKQLALIGEAQGDENDEAPPSTEPTEKAVSGEEISRLYDGYLNARERLLQSVQLPPAPMPQPLLDPPPVAQHTPAGTQNDASTTLLPFIPPLLSARNEEQSQIQRAAYMRRQLKAEETDNERLMRRLADESHLVHPGASKGQDWYDAASEAGKATEEFVRKKIEGGEKAAGEAERTVEEIGRVPGELERLVER